MRPEVATSISSEEAQPAVARRSWRTLAVQLLGPITVFAGVVWAVAQPYRIVLLNREGQGLYDYLFQPQLLVVLVGLVFTLCIAPGLVEDFDAEEQRGPPA